MQGLGADDVHGYCAANVVLADAAEHLGINTRALQAQAGRGAARVSMRYAPEFIVGPQQSTTYVTFFWSPTCPDTRDLYASVMKAFIVQTARDRKATLIVHLQPRNETDVDISRTLLSVQPQFYARYALTVLERFVANRRAPTSADVAAIAAEKRFSRDPRFSANGATSMIRIASGINYQIARVRDTPSLFANGERAVYPRSLNELVDYLRRRASYAG